MGKRQKKPEEELKKWIVMIDVSKDPQKTVYGAIVVDKLDLKEFLNYQRMFLHYSELRNKKQKAVYISKVPEKIRKLQEKHFFEVLVASDRLKPVVETLGPYIPSSTVYADPMVKKKLEKMKEFRNVRLHREDRRAFSPMLKVVSNILDSFINWVRITKKNIKRFVEKVWGR